MGFWRPKIGADFSGDFVVSKPVTFRAVPGFYSNNILDIMKTLIALASVSALAALALSSVSLESAASAFVAVGFAVIAFNDYSRKARPLTTSVAVAGGGRSERLGLAA
jgi:hypothetical protein